MIRTSVFLLAIALTVLSYYDENTVSAPVITDRVSFADLSDFDGIDARNRKDFMYHVYYFVMISQTILSLYHRYPISGI